MNTLPPYALDSNPTKYTVYALAEDAESITWGNVVYIGLSNNPDYRFQQHLSCSDKSNPDKNQWVQEHLTQGKQIMLLRIEEDINTVEQGRAREQYWIRYAFDQGADLFNRAITYTDEERIHIHQKRAEEYARIAELLAQGIYVKQYGPQHYPPRLLTFYEGKRILTILNARAYFFTTFDDRQVSIEAATDEEFDAFIREYIPVEDRGISEWYTSERCKAINFACFHGQLCLEKVGIQ